MSDVDQDRAAFAGQVADLPVIDLLRTVVHGKKTGTVRFDSPLGRGTIWFRDGEFIDADMGRFHLEDAIRQLLRLREGTFEVEYKPITRTRLIKDSTPSLLQPQDDESTARTGRRPRRAPKSWSPTGGGPGSYVGPLPTAPPVPTAPAVTVASPVAIPGPTMGVPPSALPPKAPPRIEPPPLKSTPPVRSGSTVEIPAIRPGALPSAASDPSGATKSTVFGLPTRPPGDGPQNGEAIEGVSPNLASPATVRPTATLYALAAVPPGERVGSRPIELEDERSGPISVGTTWKAPARLTTTSTQEMRSIESDARSTAGGVIQPSRGASDRSLAAGIRPPTGETEAIGEPRPPSGTNDEAVDRVAPASSSSASPYPFDSGTHGGAPAIVGRYEVLLRLARGGMGTVYLCRVTGEGGFRRLFALKVIREHLSRNSEYVDMLLQEARIASRLHHPNVVGIIDIGVLSGQHYLVMDYVEGCTFSELLKAHPKHRPPQLIIPIVLDALTGLHAAHTLKEDDGSPLTLVHCDFSPHNMLVGTNGICMISDFGIARATDALSQERGVTRGKPAFLSPEQVTGARIDHRSDIFSAGVVLWNALTGEQLFGGASTEETMDQVLRRPIQTPSTVGLRPPTCFDDVCLKALQRDPERRYQSAQEMLIELRRVAITEDLLAPSTDISRWVTQSFGTQLERRRQAAGITRPSRASKPEMPVAELGPTSDSATHALMQFGEDEPPSAESSGSRTVMIEAARSVGTGRGRVSAEELAAQKLKTYLIGTATAMVAGLVFTAVLRPQWFSGGYVDEYGAYVDVPASFDIKVDRTLPKVTPPPRPPKPLEHDTAAPLDPSTPEVSPSATPSAGGSGGDVGDIAKDEPAGTALDAEASAENDRPEAAAAPEPAKPTPSRRARRASTPSKAPAPATKTVQPATDTPKDEDEDGEDEDEEDEDEIKVIDEPTPTPERELPSLAPEDESVPEPPPEAS